MNAIVVVDQNWAIGRDNDLLFSLPTDMKRFRSLTLGGTVILGRRTLDSFPGGRPLPKRRNIVITHCPDFSREGAETVSSLAAMREATAGTPPDQLWVIGGGSIYAALLSQCAAGLRDPGGRRRGGRGLLLSQSGQAARLDCKSRQRAGDGERAHLSVL